MAIKTHSGMSKRTKVTASGKVKYSHSYMRHNLRKRSKAAKRRLNQPAYINSTELKRVKQLLNI